MINLLLCRHAFCALGIVLLSVLIFLPARAQVEFPITPNTAQLNAFNQLSSLKTQQMHHIQLERITNFPEIQELPNSIGIRSLFVPRPQLAMVDLQLTFNAGSARDAEIAVDVSGLAARNAQLLQQGTSSLNAQAISQQFSALGAEMNTSAYRDMYVVRLRCPSEPKKLVAAVDLMLHILTDAQFQTENTATQINWQNSTTISAANIANHQDLSQLQAEALLYATLYGQHPYAMPVQGTARSQQHINSRLLKRFQSRFLVARNLNIAMTGQMSRLQAQGLSQKIIDALPQGQAAKSIADVTQNIAPDQRIKFLHIPSQPAQATVLWGQLAIKRTDPDYAALLIANQILADDGFESLLMQRLRQQYSYTYGVSSRLIALQSTGNWQIRYATADATLIPSMLQLQHALTQELKASLTPENLAQQKRTLLQRMNFALSSNSALTAELGLIGFYRLPSNAFQTFALQVKQLSLKDVQAALDRHFRPNQAVWVIQSAQFNEAQFRAALEQQVTMPTP